MSKEFIKGVAVTVGVFALAGGLIVTANTVNLDARNEIEKLKSELSVCKEEATAWYNATTILSDNIALAALKGFPAEKVDTNMAIPFAIKAHELNCIQPKFPTG
jgi:hypothetical protein